METEFLEKGIDAAKSGQKQLAVECFQRVLLGDPQNLKAWIWLASVLDEYEKQIYCLRRVLQIDPGNQVARNAIAHLQQQYQPNKARSPEPKENLGEITRPVSVRKQNKPESSRANSLSKAVKPTAKRVNKILVLLAISVSLISVGIILGLLLLKNIPPFFPTKTADDPSATQDITNSDSVGRSSEPITPANLDKLVQVGRVGNSIATKALISPDARWIVVGTSLGFDIYDGQTLDLVNSIDIDATFGQDQGAPVTRLIFSKDGNKLLTGSDSTSIWRVWSIPDGKALFRLDRIFIGGDIFLSSNGDYLISIISENSDYQNTIEVWNVNSGEKEKRLSLEKFIFHNSIAHNKDIFAFGTEAGAVYVLDLDKGGEPYQLIGPSEKVSSLVFSPDDSLLAVGYKDGQVYIWSLYTKQIYIQIPPQGAQINGLCFSGDNRYLIISGNSAELWRLDNNSFLYNLNTIVDECKFAPDRQEFLATHSGFIDQFIFDDISAQETGKYYMYGCDDHDHCNNVSINFDHNLVAWIDGDDLKLETFNLETSQRLAANWQYSETPSFTSVAREANRIAVGFGRSLLRVYQTSNGELLWAQKTINSITAISLSQDGNTIAAGYYGPANHLADIWQIDSEHPNSAAYSLRFLNDQSMMASPRGNILLTSYSSSSDSIYHPIYGINAWDPAKGTLLYSVSGAGSEEFSLDGSLLAYELFKEIYIVNPETNQLLYQLALPDSSVSSLLRFSNGNQYLAIVDRVSQTVNIWDIKNGQLSKSFSIALPDSYFNEEFNCAFSPDNKHFIIYPSSLEQQIWRISDGALISQNLAHSPEEINENYFIFNANGGKYMKYNKATVELQGNKVAEISIWDTNNDSQIQTIENLNPPFAFSPDGDYIAGFFSEDLGNGNYQTIIRLIRINDGQIIAESSEMGSKIVNMVFSEDGSLLGVIGNQNLIILNLPSLDKRYEFSDIPYFNDMLFDFRFSSDNERIFVNGDYSFRIFDITNGRMIEPSSSSCNPPQYNFNLGQIDDQCGVTMDLTFYMDTISDPDGSSGNYTIPKYVNESPQSNILHPVQTFPDNTVLGIQFSADASNLYTLTADPITVPLARTSNMEFRFSDQYPHHPIDLQAISWLTNSGTNQILQITPWDQVPVLSILYPPVFSADALLVATLNIDGSINIIRIQDNQIILNVPTNQGVSALAFSPDSTLLAIGYDSGIMEIRKTASGDLVSSGNDGFDYSCPVTKMAISDDNQMVANTYECTAQFFISKIGDLDNWLWSSDYGVSIFHLEFLPDNSMLVSVGLDGVMRYWGVK